MSNFLLPVVTAKKTVKSRTHTSLQFFLRRQQKIVRCLRPDQFLRQHNYCRQLWQAIENVISNGSSHTNNVSLPPPSLMLPYHCLSDCSGERTWYYVMSVIKELFDCETLIAEVEKRPPLYDFQLKEYSDKNIKEKLWSEVCEAVVSDWNTLSPEDRNEKGKKLIYLKGKH